MTPEASNYLDKARCDLDEARQIVSIGLATVAARSAYYASFHAAEALIIERTGKIVKTHSGVRAEFARLAQDTSAIERKFTTFLAKAYMYKEIGDYGVGPGASVTLDDAKDAIVVAEQFIDCIADLLTK